MTDRTKKAQNTRQTLPPRTFWCTRCKTDTGGRPHCQRPLIACKWTRKADLETCSDEERSAYYASMDRYGPGSERYNPLLRAQPSGLLLGGRETFHEIHNECEFCLGAHRHCTLAGLNLMVEWYPRPKHYGKGTEARHFPHYTTANFVACPSCASRICDLYARLATAGTPEKFPVSTQESYSRDDDPTFTSNMARAAGITREPADEDETKCE